LTDNQIENSNLPKSIKDLIIRTRNAGHEVREETKNNPEISEDLE
jgi:hypothetical protein